MNTKHLALVRALPADLLPALRARALDPFSTRDTRPFEINPVDGHLYVCRRIRTKENKRKRETYGPPAKVLEILDLLAGEKLKADFDSSTAIPDVVVGTPPPPPLVNVPSPANVADFTPSVPDSAFAQATRPLTNPWAAAMVLLMLAPCLLYLTTILIKTPERPAMIVPPARSYGVFDQPDLGQILDEQVTESPLVEPVKDIEAVEPSKVTTVSTKPLRGDSTQSARLLEISDRIQSLEEQGIHCHRLGLFFDAVRASAGVQSRHLEFNDTVPLTAGQIVEATGEKLFDQLGQMPAVLPKPLRQVWVDAGQSAVASELRDALRFSVTAVAFQPDLLGDQLILRSQSLRLAASLRAAYGVPSSVDTWRDPDSGWFIAILGTCVVIRE